MHKIKLIIGLAKVVLNPRLSLRTIDQLVLGKLEINDPVKPQKMAETTNHGYLKVPESDSRTMSVVKN